MKAITIRLDDDDDLRSDFMLIKSAIKDETGMEPSASEIIRGLIRDRARELKNPKQSE